MLHMKKGFFIKCCGVCLAVLPAWGDGYMSPGDYTQQWRSEAEGNGRGAVIQAVDRYWCDRDTLPEEHEARREGLRKAVLAHPAAVNDCEYACGAPFSALSAAVWLDDVEMVDFLLAHGAYPFGGSMHETMEMLNPAKTDARIIESLRKAQCGVNVLEALVKAAEMPERSWWRCPHLMSEQYEGAVAATADGGFTRLPQKARFDTEGLRDGEAVLVRLEGLVESAEQGAVSFVTIGLGVSPDGRLLSLDQRVLREGAERPSEVWSPYIITHVPYVFTIPRAEGGVSILTFNREAKTLTHTVLDKNGAPVSSELLCPRVHKGGEYKRGEGGRLSTEGFELPAADVLLCD